MRYVGVPGPGEQSIPNLENLFKSLLFPVLIGIGFVAANAVGALFDEMLRQDNSGVFTVIGKWGVLAILAVINAVFLTGMGILAHDAVHKVLFKNLFWNEFIGGLLSGFSLLPFCTNRQFHLNHHSFAHQPGKDPENQFHDKPYYNALVLGALFALYEQYMLLIMNAVKSFSNPGFRVRVIRDSLTTGFVALAYFYLVPKSGLDVSYTVLPLIAALPLVFSYRAISDHYGLPAVIRKNINQEDADDETLDQFHDDVTNKKIQYEVTGWVILTNSLVTWLWSNVNYHEVHHKFPYLSYKYLPQAFEATRKILPYAVKKGYTASLFSLRKSNYYSQPEDVSSFLTIPRQ